MSSKFPNITEYIEQKIHNIEIENKLSDNVKEWYIKNLKYEYDLKFQEHQLQQFQEISSRFSNLELKVEELKTLIQLNQKEQEKDYNPETKKQEREFKSAN